MANKAIYNLREKATGDLYMICLCGCGTKRTDGPSMFNSAEEAMEYTKIADLKGWFPVVHVDDTWKRREIDRFKSGQYELPVWHDEPWAKESKERVFDKHYPHISQDQPDVIAFTDTPEKGMEDVQTRIKPGKFLQRFYGKVLTGDEIEKWSAKHVEEWSKGPELLLAKTPDEISMVYTMDSGFSSCMQKPVNNFPFWLNPTRVYGGGDLAVGYVLDKRGKLIARAVMWPDKKKVGRVYGDLARFRAALKATLGFESKSDLNIYDGFSGAKLEKLEFGRGYILPYIDSSSHGVGGVSIKEDHMVLVGSRSDSNQYGMMNFEGHKCNRCATHIGSRYYGVLRDSSNLSKLSRVCSKCIGNYTQVELNGAKVWIDPSSFRMKEILTYTKDGKMVLTKVITVDETSYVTVVGSPNVYILKSESMRVNDGYMHQEEVKIQGSRIYKSDYDGSLRINDYGHNAPVKVDGETWTAWQAQNYAEYVPSTNKFRLPANRRPSVTQKDVDRENAKVYREESRQPSSPRKLYNESF